MQDYGFTNLTSLFCERDRGILFLEGVNLDPINWLEKNRELLQKAILVHGGVVLRNFRIESVAQFNQFAQTFAPNLLEYIYRSTPRKKMGGRIYTTTEYPAALSIPMHNENAYTNLWPETIMFYCAVPPATGGETPVADSRCVLERMPPGIVEAFERHGVMTVRHYYENIDLNWREVFQTDSRTDVEKYCSKNNIEYEWLDGGSAPELRTRQICQATLLHPVTGEKVWFNQAHLFHVSQLGKDEANALVQALGEDRLPRNSFYGDNSPIEAETLQIINDAYEAEKFKFKWKAGDLMILDNRLMAHGREPFAGERKILAAMA